MQITLALSSLEFVDVEESHFIAHEIKWKIIEFFRIKLPHSNFPCLRK